MGDAIDLAIFREPYGGCRGDQLHRVDRFGHMGLEPRAEGAGASSARA